MMRVGVIGVGSMGVNHARVYSEIGDLVGIADPDVSRGRRIAKKFNTHYFRDYNDLLRNDLDAVTIATPTHTHREVASEVIDNNVSLLIEKPLANNLEDAVDIYNMARDNGVTLAVGHIERHNPIIEYIMNAFDEGDFGDIITISTRRVSFFPGRIRDVGVIMDLGIHDIDIIKYLAHSRVRNVFALGGKSSRNGPEGHEDHVTILMHFDNGITGSVEANWLTPRKVRTLSLTCSKKFVEADYINQSIEISTSTAFEVDETDLYLVPHQYEVRQISLEKKEPLKRELQDFLEASKNKHPPLVTGLDGIEAIQISEAALSSIKQNKSKMLDHIELES